MVFSNPYFRDYVRDAVDDPFDVSSDVFNYAADTRLAIQKTTFGWAGSYYDWSRGVWDSYPPGEAIVFEEDWADNIVRSLMLVGIPLAYLPFVAVTSVPYFGMWPVALALDAYNIYRYFD